MKALSTLLLFLALSCQAQLPVVPMALNTSSHVGTDPGPPDEGWRMEGINGNDLASISGNHNMGIVGGGGGTVFFTNDSVNNLAFYSTNTGGATRGWAFTDDATLGAGAGVSFTFTFWYKTFAGQPNLANAIIAKWDYTAQSKQDYVVDTGSHGDNLAWTCNNVAANAYGNINWNNPTPSTNVWHFVCVGYDDSQQQVFMSVDGATLRTASLVGTHRTVTTSLEFFNYPVSGSQGSWSGILDEVYLWKKAINLNDIQYLYKAGAGRFY